MTHAAIADVTEAVTVQRGAVVSKVIHRDGVLDVTIFAFDRGEGLTEHAASRTAIVQVPPHDGAILNRAPGSDRSPTMETCEVTGSS